MLAKYEHILGRKTVILQPFQRLTQPRQWRLIWGMEAIDPYILFVVEKPPKGADDKESVQWQNFCSNVFDNEVLWPNTNIVGKDDPRKRLAENVWLLELKADAPFLGRLMAAAAPSAANLKHRCLIFDGIPPWEVFGQ